MAPAPNLQHSPPPDQLRHCIERLQLCITELHAFDTHRVRHRRNDPEVIALEVSIADAVGVAFRHCSPLLDFYKDAATLDQGPLPADVDPGSATETPLAAEDRQAVDARQYLSEGKKRSLLLLRRAVHSLEDEIAEREDEARAAAAATQVAAPAAAEPRLFMIQAGAGEASKGVARFLARVGLGPILLHDQPDRGKSAIKDCEARPGMDFAIVLLTPEESREPQSEHYARTRQELVLELGYFVGRLTRAKVFTLNAGDVDPPSSVLGIVWTAFDKDGVWQIGLAKQLKAAGFDIEWNKVMAPWN